MLKVGVLYTDLTVDTPADKDFVTVMKFVRRGKNGSLKFNYHSGLKSYAMRGANKEITFNPGIREEWFYELSGEAEANADAQRSGYKDFKEMDLLLWDNEPSEQ